MKITEEIKRRIVELIKEGRTVPETAGMVGCGVSSVKKVMRDNNIVRTAKVKSAIRSRVRSEYVRAERRRAIFGLDQRTNLKVFSNKDRIILRYCLKRKGYVFKERGGNTAYYSEETSRDRRYEEKGIKLGLRFQQI